MRYNFASFFASKTLPKKATVYLPYSMPDRDLELSRKEEKGLEGYFTAGMDLALALHSFSENDRLLEFALDSLLSILNASAGSLFLWEETSKELVLNKAAGPYLRKVTGARVQLREGVSGRVAEQGLSILVKDIHRDERFREFKRSHPRNYRSHSFISLPLLAGNKLVGVINLTEKENLVPFDEEDLDRAETFANHIAVAYENLKIKKRIYKENEELNQKVAHLKETLRRQESLVSIGKLASNLAHELNNPLDSIRRFVNLALEQVMEDSLGREYLLKAKKGIRRAVQVIRGLLSFSREINPQILRKEELHKIIEQSLTLASQTPSFEKIRFEKKFFPKSLLIEDRGLAGVFQNLFDNAHHAMKGEGTITISTQPNGQYVTVSIRDTGCGVHPSHQERIFEPFFSTKENGEGTGIGLAICQEIIERSGGEIRFESAEKKGTTFFIKLPYQHEREEK